MPARIAACHISGDGSAMSTTAMPGLWTSSRAASVSTSGAGACGPTSSTSGSSPSTSCSNSRAGSPGRRPGGRTWTSPSVACLTRRIRSSPAPARTTRLIGVPPRRSLPGSMTRVPLVSSPSVSRDSHSVPCSMPKTTVSASLAVTREGHHQAGRRARRPASRLGVGRRRVGRRRGALHLGDQHVVQDGGGLPRAVRQHLGQVDADGVAGGQPAADDALRLQQDADLLQARRAPRRCPAPAGRRAARTGWRAAARRAGGRRWPPGRPGPTGR